MRVAMRVAVPLSVLALVVSGCSADEPTVNNATSLTSPTPAVTTTPAPTTAAPSPTRDTRSTIATAKSNSIDVYPDPNESDTTTIRAADVLTAPGETPLVFLVKTVTDGWLEVWLPVRPNGSTAWVRASEVTLADTYFWVDVDLAEYHLKVYDNHDVVYETQIGIGQDNMPTPGGTYYIRELLQPPNPAGAYGPYAYGLSGFSPVLDSFAGGDAVIGIHGTDTPTSIGATVSHGCIRMSNDAITDIVNDVGLPLGTPIYISS